MAAEAELASTVPIVFIKIDHAEGSIESDSIGTEAKSIHNCVDTVEHHGEEVVNVHIDD